MTPHYNQVLFDISLEYFKNLAIILVMAIFAFILTLFIPKME